MEFGSSVAYCSDVSDEEYAPGTPQKRYDDDQPRLKPSHFRSRPSQIIDGTPRLLCAEDDKRSPSDFTLSLQLPPGYQPGLRSRAVSDGFLLSEAMGPATDLSVTSEDVFREPLVSPPPSEGGKRDKKRNKLKRTTALFIPKGIMKKLGKKKREHSVHVKWDDDADDDEGHRIPRVHQLTDSRPRRTKPKRVHMVHDAPPANTNVIAVRYSTLANPVQVHTGDSVVCRNDRCTAVLSHLSRTRLEEKPGAELKLWHCEFCGTEQEVDLALEEVPSASDTTYMVAPPPLSGSGAQGGEATMEDSLVVFCIDTSGSMGVTTPVPGRLNLRGRDQLQSLSVLNSENVAQYMPHERRDITYVSQLQSVQAAVDQQLDNLLRSQPTHRVALITFSDEVHVIGDGRSQEVVVAGGRLDDPEALAKISTQLPAPSAIRHSRDILSRKLLDLEESGQTALGPALQLSVLLAARVAGSRVIICTDGLANKGVGSIDVSRRDETFASAQVFYKDLGDIAMENGACFFISGFV